MNENYQEKLTIYTLSVYVMFSCMILLFGSNTLLAEGIDHQGEKVNTNDVAVCMACHENMGDHSHPIMIPYPPTNKEKAYPPVSEVTKAGIKLQDSKISCITCHDLNNPEPHHPIKEMEGQSKLCLVCHNK